MVVCVSSQLKPSGFSIFSCEKSLGIRPRTFFTAKNGELLGLYPIHNLLYIGMIGKSSLTEHHSHVRSYSIKEDANKYSYNKHTLYIVIPWLTKRYTLSHAEFDNLHVLLNAL